MTQNTITLIVLAVLVVFSLPALYRKKKSGDLTLWGKGRNILGQLPSEEAACAAVSSSSRNGSQKDILQFVSSLMKLVRKNHWYIVMPGQLSDGKTKTNLSLVLITQHRVIGLKCYGYGGALTNNGKAADWTQKLDKTTKAIHSPLPDQTAQQAALASLLPQLNLPTSIFSFCLLLCTAQRLCCVQHGIGHKIQVCAAADAVKVLCKAQLPGGGVRRKGLLYFLIRKLAGLAQCH